MRRALLPLLLLTGCLRPTLLGGDVVTAVPPGTAYRAARCVSLAEGRTVPAPDGVTWHVSPDGAALFEREADGSALALTNHWTDATGGHFLVAVQDVGGRVAVAHVFDVPGERDAPILRWTWPAGTYTLGMADGVTRVVAGEPSIRCELRPE